MSGLNLSSNTSKFHRLPSKRVFISDLDEGRWNDPEKIISTRYGDLKRVRVCGVLINKRDVIQQDQEESFLDESSNSNTRVSFQIDDGTGRIWGTIWGANPEDFSHIKKSMTVDLAGIVRSYKNSPQLTVEFIREIKDPNFETYHVVEIQRKRKLEPKFDIPKESAQNFDDFNFDLPSENSLEDNFLNQLDESSTSNSQDKTPSMSNISSDSIGNNAFDGVDLLDQIVDYILQNDQGDGVLINKIASQFKKSNEDMKQILEQLCQDVKIYKVQPGYYSSY